MFSTHQTLVGRWLCNRLCDFAPNCSSKLIVLVEASRSSDLSSGNAHPDFSSPTSLNHKYIHTHSRSVLLHLQKDTTPKHEPAILTNECMPIYKPVQYHRQCIWCYCKIMEVSTTFICVELWSKMLIYTQKNATMFQLHY